MRILGIDTSTRFLCIGIFDDKIGTAEFRIELGNRLSSHILPMTKRILDSLKITMKDIDYFTVGLGPGSFTGMRIGLSVMKGLAYALNKPLIGISSLDILALNAKTLLPSNYGLPYAEKPRGLNKIMNLNKLRICPVIDAKRNLVFSSLYLFKNGQLKRIKPYRLIRLEELPKEVSRQTVFLGDGLGLYKNSIKLKVKRAVFLDEDYWFPTAGSIIELARERISIKKIDNIKTIQPLYLYPKECQIKNENIKMRRAKSKIKKIKP